MLRYNTSMSTNGVFYADSNAREMVERVYNKVKCCEQLISAGIIVICCQRLLLTHVVCVARPCLSQPLPNLGARCRQLLPGRLSVCCAFTYGPNTSLC